MFWGSSYWTLSALESLPSGSLHFNLFCAPLQDSSSKRPSLVQNHWWCLSQHSIHAEPGIQSPLQLDQFPKTPGSFILHCNYVHSHLIFLLTMNVSPGRVRDPRVHGQILWAHTAYTPIRSFTASLLTPDLEGGSVSCSVSLLPPSELCTFQ